MNLPELNTLRDDQSTYITFTKTLLDFDYANANGQSCYFTKMVALNLPDWKNPEFFIELGSVGVDETNPNVAFPKAIQYYMENIIRQDISVNDENVEEITELAFWKMLGKMGLTTEQQRACVTFSNTIATSNFIKTENNNGWGEIVGQIPNKCKLLTPVWREVANVKDTVQCDDEDTALYDNGLKQFLFDADSKNVLDFENFAFDEVTEQEFNFNVLLLYYKDSSGIEKLHGINFIYPWENKVTYWDIERFIQKTNKARTIGYQFKFNQKTCNNEASQIQIYELQENSHWNVFSETLSKLNSFLEVKINEG